MRRLLALLVLALSGFAGGCGGSDPASAAGGAAQVASTSCAVSDVVGKPASRSCTFVLSDGRRWRCNRFFTGPGPTVSRLERTAGCRRLASLVFSPAERAVRTRLERARSCLVGKGLRPAGGLVLPAPGPASTEPDGELVIAPKGVAFIAVYTTAPRARRIEPILRQSHTSTPILFERRGTVTIAWSGNPASAVRNMVWACVPQ